ncbi:AAA family ATPase [Candidatus Parvarchaeota archaeon]|nr:AAA family ATPase [Candidatus Parvarchaeota archaeon]
MIIAISGTPGTGKHTLAKELAKKTNYGILDLNRILKKGNKEREVTLKEVNEAFQKNKKDNLLVVSHLSHFIRSKSIDFVIVLRTDPLILIKRLEKRGYTKEKIYDNALFEAMNGTCSEALKMKKKVFQINNTKNLKNTVKKAMLIIAGKEKGENVDFSDKILKVEKMFK